MASNNQSSRQYLTFGLDREVFALDIVKVREVLELTEVCELPSTPDYMKGVINLRGHAVPVMDMRGKLGMGPGEQTVDTCIIILEAGSAGRTESMGVVVDSVRAVVRIEEKDIEPAPRTDGFRNADYIEGLGHSDGRFIIIVDMDAAFAGVDLPSADRMDSALDTTPDSALAAGHEPAAGRAEA